MTSKRKIAIYGGTFNPPHIAHVQACKSFVERIMPDEVIIIPSYIPPHKAVEGCVDPYQRVEMARLAFSDIAGAVVSDMEIARGGTSYTAITLTELSNDESELYFLCGTDMFLSMDTWYRPDIIFNLATVCCIRRECVEENTALLESKARYFEKEFAAKTLIIPVDAIELSSTEIREKISRGENVSELVPAKVLKYIEREGIYL